MSKEEKLLSFDRDNKASIQILQSAEQQILRLLEIAAKTSDELSKLSTNQELNEETSPQLQQQLSRLSGDYLACVKKIKEILKVQIEKITEEGTLSGIPSASNTVGSSIGIGSYGSRMDAHILSMKIILILKHLSSLESTLGHSSIQQGH